MKFLFLVATLIITTSSFARGGGQRGGDRVPPSSAISACEGKAEKTACTVEGRNGKERAGTCENTPDGKYFACKPERGGKRG